jgi:hypothetical protein
MSEIDELSDRKAAFSALLSAEKRIGGCPGRHFVVA